MHHRCNSSNYQKVHPNYSDVTVEFYCFQEFVDWHRQQVGYVNTEWHLDKDLLFKGNKVYSPVTCLLLPRELNSLIVFKSSNKDNLACGVRKKGNSFIAGATFKGESIYLGSYPTELGAFEAYKTAKEDFIKQQANKWRDKIDPRAYEALMTYEVLITD